MDKTGTDLDARIYLDGEYKGESGWDGEYTASDLSSGNYYKVRAEKEGYLSNNETVHLSPSEQKI